MKYYVDNQVPVSGTGNSWSFAWKSFSDIDWSKIRPGDTIYISGGAVSQTYNDMMTVGAGGSAAGTVTITKGVDPGHNGNVIIDGQGTLPSGINDNGYNYVDINGLAIRNIADAGIWVKSVTAGVIVENNSVYSGDPGGGNARGYDVRDSVGQNAVIVRNNSYSTPDSTRAQTDGIWSSGNNGVVFKSNNIVISNSDSTGHNDGFQSYEDINVIVDGNYISHPNGGIQNHGMFISDIAAGGTLTIENNVVSIPVGDSLGIIADNINPGWTGQANIYNNTVYGGSWDFTLWNTPLSQLKNNIGLPAAGGIGVLISNGSPPAGNIDHNLIWAPSANVANVDGSYETWSQWQALSYDTHGVNADPLVTNLASNDFRLQANSPAIGAGSTLPTVTSDYAGTTRPQDGAYDIGAFEFGTPPPVPMPAPVVIGTGSDTLVLSMAEDAYLGDAQFTVAISGKQLGGTFTATALHTASVSQDFIFKGDWAPDTHTVTVTFLNDAWDGTAATDRNLYVNGLSYDGTATGQSAALMSAGPHDFMITDTTPMPGVTLTGTAGNDSLLGGAGNDTMIGFGGNDVLNGEAGADAMAGGTGNDTYYVDNAADVVTENPGEGTDIVWASVNYALTAGTEVETLKVNATAGLTLTGNAYSHNLIGNVGNDTVIGGSGNDVLNGGAGADTMAGGAGNDTYYVDNAADVVNEDVGGGTDTVWAGVNYALATGTEAEALRANATTGLKLTGNAYSHTLVGNVGNDTLIGGIGNDVLNGGTGADAMAGGAGNDTYYVDNAADVVNENVGGGTDTVFASVNYALAVGTEVETLRANATTGLKLTGNAYSHNLIGNIGNESLTGGAGNDTLNGCAGADTTVGGIGNDTYFVDNANDVVTENVGEGTDTVWASTNYTLSATSEIEFLNANALGNLTLTGNALNNTITASVGKDALIGGGGNDVLISGTGNDRLTGDTGNDIFKFLAAGFGQDVITDFTVHAGLAANKDLMDISGLGITAATLAANVHIAASAGGATTVTFVGSTDSIRLLNTAPASIGMSDFKLA